MNQGRLGGGDWRAEHLRFERRMMRYLCWWEIIPALVVIPVAAAHDVPTAIAAAAGGVQAAVFVVLAITWRGRWRWPAATVTVLALFWPALVWWPWVAIAGLAALALAIWAVGLAILRRNAHTAALRLAETRSARDSAAS